LEVYNNINEIYDRYIDIELNKDESIKYIKEFIAEMRVEINKHIYSAPSQTTPTQQFEQKKENKIPTQKEFKIVDKIEEYKSKFKGNLSSEEIGKRYERYIGYLYEMDNYKVEYNGITKSL